MEPAVGRLRAVAAERSRFVHGGRAGGVRIVEEIECGERRGAAGHFFFVQGKCGEWGHHCDIAQVRRAGASEKQKPAGVTALDAAGGPAGRAFRVLKHITRSQE